MSSVSINHTTLQAAEDTLRHDQEATSSDVKVFSLLTVLSLIVLLLHPPGIWYTQTPLVAFIVCGFIRRELLSNSVYWLGICGLLAADLMIAWFYVDNHKFVELYWCSAILAATFATSASDRMAVLQWNARLLLAAVMLFAVLWKAISYSYMSGEFFEYVLITDERFQHLTHWFAGLDYATLYSNREALDHIKSAHLDHVSLNSVQLNSSEQVATLSWGMTWWTIIIESIIGLLFLVCFYLPNRFWTATADYTLLAFAVSTYLFAPVVGFGWLLMIMGFTQSTSAFRRRLFCIAFVLVLVYSMPYHNIVNNYLLAGF